MWQTAWRKRKIRRKKKLEQNDQQFTPAQQFRTFVLISAVLCGAAGGWIGKEVTDDRMSQVLCWLAGVICGIGIASLIGAWVKRREKAKKPRE